jgi:hypothetical protein
MWPNKDTLETGLKETVEMAMQHYDPKKRKLFKIKMQAYDSIVFHTTREEWI